MTRTGLPLVLRARSRASTLLTYAADRGIDDAAWLAWQGMPLPAHLESAGFTGAPRFLGIDGSGP